MHIWVAAASNLVKNLSSCAWKNHMEKCERSSLSSLSPDWSFTRPGLWLGKQPVCCPVYCLALQSIFGGTDPPPIPPFNSGIHTRLVLVTFGNQEGFFYVQLLISSGDKHVFCLFWFALSGIITVLYSAQFFNQTREWETPQRVWG